MKVDLLSKLAHYVNIKVELGRKLPCFELQRTEDYQKTCTNLIKFLKL